MDAAEDRMWWYRAVHARVIDALLCRPGDPARPVLDAGCGTGGLLRRMGEATGRPLVGVEYQAEAAGRARRKSRAVIAIGDVNAMPFRDGAFGAAVSIDVLCHRMVSPEQGLVELRRVLAPGATLVVNLPAFEWLKSAHDRRVHNDRRATARAARAMLAAAGFAQVEARYWNALLLPLMVLQRKVLSAGEAAASDVAHYPPWLNRTLHGITAVERRLAAAGLRFPAGGSVLLVATRP